eukprot:gene8476-4837_t
MVGHCKNFKGAHNAHMHVWLLLLLLPSLCILVAVDATYPSPAYQYVPNPPADNPPADYPSAGTTPPAYPFMPYPPATSPPVDIPPADSPPANSPPVNNPPADNPSPSYPLVASPPIDNPPAQNPPAPYSPAAPPATHPPAQNPPAPYSPATPPATHPPATNPPATMSPATYPPANNQPADNPSAANPPPAYPSMPYTPADSPTAEYSPAANPPPAYPSMPYTPAVSPTAEYSPAANPPPAYPSMPYTPADSPTAEYSPAANPPPVYPSMPYTPVDSPPAEYSPAANPPPVYPSMPYTPVDSPTAEYSPAANPPPVYPSMPYTPAGSPTAEYSPAANPPPVYPSMPYTPVDSPTAEYSPAANPPPVYPSMPYTPADSPTAEYSPAANPPPVYPSMPYTPADSPTAEYSPAANPPPVYPSMPYTPADSPTAEYSPAANPPPVYPSMPYTPADSPTADNPPAANPPPVYPSMPYTPADSPTAEYSPAANPPPVYPSMPYTPADYPPADNPPASNPPPAYPSTPYTPADSPTAEYYPAANIPPAYLFSPYPSENNPPADNPPAANIPPAYASTPYPSEDYPLADNPPANNPLADNPPADNPPTDTRATDKPPDYNPPADNPPADYSPANNSLADSPPADIPPTDNSVAGNPPDYNPPADNPPADYSPANNSPANSTLADYPPADNLVADYPPAENLVADNPPDYNPPADYPPAYDPDPNNPDPDYLAADYPPSSAGLGGNDFDFGLDTTFVDYDYRYDFDSDFDFDYDCRLDSDFDSAFDFDLCFNTSFSGQTKFMMDLQGLLASAAQVPSTSVVLTSIPSSGRRLFLLSAKTEVSAVVWFAANYEDVPSQISSMSAFSFFELRLRKTPGAMFGSSTLSTVGATVQVSDIVVYLPTGGAGGGDYADLLVDYEDDYIPVIDFDFSDVGDYEYEYGYDYSADELLANAVLDFGDSEPVIELLGEAYVEVPEWDSFSYEDDGALMMDSIDGISFASHAIYQCQRVQNIEELAYLMEAKQLLPILNCNKSVNRVDVSRPAVSTEVFVILYGGKNSQGTAAALALRVVALSRRCLEPERWCPALDPAGCSYFGRCISLGEGSISDGYSQGVTATAIVIGTALPRVTLLGTGQAALTSTGETVMIDEIPFDSKWKDPGATAIGYPYGVPVDITASVTSFGAGAVDTLLATPPAKNYSFLITYTAVDEVGNAAAPARRLIKVNCIPPSELCFNPSNGKPTCTVDGFCGLPPLLTRTSVTAIGATDIDTSAPNLTLQGPPVMTVPQATAYSRCPKGSPVGSLCDAGATAEDLEDGPLTQNIKVCGYPFVKSTRSTSPLVPILLACNISTRHPGTFKIKFSVTNSAGFASRVERKLVVKSVCLPGSRLCDNLVDCSVAGICKSELAITVLGEKSEVPRPTISLVTYPFLGESVELCEPGAVAFEFSLAGAGATLEDANNVTQNIVACPRPDCLVGAPCSAVDLGAMSLVNRGLGGCAIDSLAPVGTIFPVAFWVWDYGVPARRSVVVRKVVISKPCPDPAKPNFCRHGSRFYCSPSDCKTSEAYLPDPTEVPVLRLLPLNTSTVFIELGNVPPFSLAPCPSLNQNSSCGAVAFTKLPGSLDIVQDLTSKIKVTSTTNCKDNPTTCRGCTMAQMSLGGGLCLAGTYKLTNYSLAENVVDAINSGNKSRGEFMQAQNRVATAVLPQLSLRGANIELFNATLLRRMVEVHGWMALADTDWLMQQTRKLDTNECPSPWDMYLSEDESPAMPLSSMVNELESLSYSNEHGQEDEGLHLDESHIGDLGVADFGTLKLGSRHLLQQDPYTAAVFSIVALAEGMGDQAADMYDSAVGMADDVAVRLAPIKRIEDARAAQVQSNYSALIQAAKAEQQMVMDKSDTVMSLLKANIAALNNLLIQSSETATVLRDAIAETGAATDQAIRETLLVQS